MQPNCSRLRALVALCSVFVTAAIFSLPSGNVPVLCPFSLSRTKVSETTLSGRVLARLEQAECKEISPWVRDDIRIAWLTVLYASRGEKDAHFWATYRVLGMPPDQVWPSIVERRMAMLGPVYAARYEEFFGETSPPKKPAQGVRFDEARRRSKAQAA